MCSLKKAEACNWDRCFPANFAKFLRTPFLQNTYAGTASDLRLISASYRNHPTDLQSIHLFLYEGELFVNGLTHFMPLVSFYTPRKHQKTRSFLMISKGVEVNQLT